MQAVAVLLLREKKKKVGKKKATAESPVAQARKNTSYSMIL